MQKLEERGNQVMPVRTLGSWELYKLKRTFVSEDL